MPERYQKLPKFGKEYKQMNIKLQNYVSNELTHFVGRGLPTDAERYELFCQIIKSGLLKGKVDNGKGSTLVNVDPNFDFSGNQMYNPNIVCFCDIPEDDFSIHMDKYSHFGIAFSKDFLVAQGTRPVFLYSARISFC